MNAVRCGLSAALLLASVTVPANSQTVVDGDTLTVRGERIRLHGIDAPELRQVCKDSWRAGEASKAALQRLVSVGGLECQPVTKDRYGRTVATCSVRGEDVGAAMVRQGMAWAYTRYSWRYLLDDWLAWFEGLGIHAHDCIVPSEYRAQQRR